MSRTKLESNNIPIEQISLSLSKSWGEQMRAYRKQRNMSLRELGAIIGVMPSNLSNWETKGKSTSIEFITRYAKALGCQKIIISTDE